MIRNHDDGEIYEDSADDCSLSKAPEKKRRLEKQDSFESDDNVKLASDFLFKLPATASEISLISDTVISKIQTIHKIISEGGYDAYNTLRSSVDKDRYKSDSQAPPNYYRDESKSLEESIIRGDPRRYQIALFERAKVQNTIVHLETGKGKTLVALLLIRHLSYLYQEGKQTLFLVPSVALAMQHSATLRANLPYTVATASHNSTRNPGAREAMAASNILVATHGAILDLFMHYGDLFQMQRINLLVVDECHYACGEHGYAQIMKNFYHPLDTNTRPRILGLTASPLMNVKHDVSNDELSSQLSQLENILNSKIICLSHFAEEKDEDLKRQEAEERIVYYKNKSNLPPFPDHMDIGLHPTREKEFNQFLYLYKELGPMVCSIYSSTVARELSQNKYDRETPDQYESAINHLKYISRYCEEISKKCPNGGKSEKVALLEQLLEDMIEYNNSRNPIGLVFVERRISAVALFDYFRTRMKLLKLGKWFRVENTEYYRRGNRQFSHLNLDVPNYDSDGYSNIESFNIEDMTMKQIEDVSICNVLQDLIPTGVTLKNLMETELDAVERSDSESILSGNDTIRCDLAVRKCTQLFRNFDRTNKEKELAKDEDWLHKPINMEEILNALKSKRTNLLFATSVVEEGVDISSCSFVIAFDNIKTTKIYVQMKGRARQQNAKFFVFQDLSPTSTNQFIDLKSAQVTNTRVKQFIESRPNYSLPLLERKLNFQPHEYETRDLELSAAIRGEYRTKYALVNFGSARNLLNRYYLSIPVQDVDSLVQVPHFDRNRLLLPAHLPISIRCVVLPDQFMSCRNKEKQNILSFIACVRLHRFCLLSDRLLPLKKKDMQKKLLDIALSSSSLPPPSKPPSTLYSAFIYELEQTGKVFDKYRRILGGDGISLCFITLSCLPKVFLKNPMHFMHHQIGEIHVHIREIRKTVFDKEEWDLCAKFQTVLFNARWRKPKSTIFYVHNSEKVKDRILSTSAIGCLNKRKEIDWDIMASVIHEYQRTKEERIDAVKKHSVTSVSTKPRLWVPINDSCESYISYGPSGLQCSDPYPEKTSTIQTYADYFKELNKYTETKLSLLILAQQQWYLPGKIRTVDESVLRSQDKNTEMTPDAPSIVVQENHRSLCDGLTLTLIPLDVCMEAPIAQADVFFLCTFLPQILYYIERYVTASLFVDHCRDQLPVLGSFLDRIAVDHFDEILEVLTAKSCSVDRNYDRLEWLGDGVLKLIHTDSLLYSDQLYKWASCLHEGDLSLLRSSLGSNEILFRMCERIGFNKYILFRPFGRGLWAPTGLELYSIHSDGTLVLSELNQSRPGRKICADVIESIIGLIYIKFDFNAAYNVASELGITLPRGAKTVSKVPNYKRKADLEDAAFRILGGFRFNNPELLEEALTHPSCLHEQVPSYQQLEWVGDAALCLFARNWIFHKFPNLTVGELVVMEASIVCNETLAYICILNKLQVYLNHVDTSLPKKIADYEHSVGPKGRGLWATDPPKALSDIVESIVGAVYVDASYTECHQVLNHMLKPVLSCLMETISNNNHTLTNSVNRMIGHPQQYIENYLGGKINVRTWREDKFDLREHKIRCPIWKDGYWGTSSNTGSHFISVVYFLDIELFAVEELSARVARNRSCALTKEIFESNPDLLLKLYGILNVISNFSVKA